MEIMNVVGTRYVNFKDDSGKQIDGWSIYYTMKADGVTGLIAGKMFVSSQRAESLVLPQVGSTYEVNYDRYGRPTRFDLVK